MTTGNEIIDTWQRESGGTLSEVEREFVRAVCTWAPGSDPLWGERGRRLDGFALEGRP